MKKSRIFLLVVVVAITVISIAIMAPLPADKSLAAYQETSANMSDSYPEHPETLQDCENTSKKNFCIDDLAEVTNNISLCGEINDADIRIDCRARISVDENMCSTISDPGLKEACLESIKMKRGWLNGNTSQTT